MSAPSSDDFVQLERAKKALTALKNYAEMERTPTSKTVPEMVNYVADHEKEDPLINGQLKVANPLEERSRCVIL